jgi:Protein of unknown function (DUF3224)
MIANGTFAVQMKPQDDTSAVDGVSLGRMQLDKSFVGDLVGAGKGQMLTAMTAMTAVKGSAGYVAIERVSGSLHGKVGSFVMQHSGTMDKGAQQLLITLVPDSGTGALVGIRGVFQLRVEAGQHHYALDYTLPQ